VRKCEGAQPADLCGRRNQSPRVHPARRRPAGLAIKQSRPQQLEGAAHAVEATTDDLDHDTPAVARYAHILPARLDRAAQCSQPSCAFRSGTPLRKAALGKS